MTARENNLAIYESLSEMEWWKMRKIHDLIEEMENKKIDEIPGDFSNFEEWINNLDFNKHKKWYLNFLDRPETEKMLLKLMENIKKNWTAKFPFTMKLLKMYLVDNFESLWIGSCCFFSIIFENGHYVAEKPHIELLEIACSTCIIADFNIKEFSSFRPFNRAIQIHAIMNNSQSQNEDFIDKNILVENIDFDILFAIGYLVRSKIFLGYRRIVLMVQDIKKYEAMVCWINTYNHSVSIKICDDIKTANDWMQIDFM